jgi:hypothetical protein
MITGLCYSRRNEGARHSMKWTEYFNAWICDKIKFPKLKQMHVTYKTLYLPHRKQHNVRQTSW